MYKAAMLKPTRSIPSAMALLAIYMFAPNSPANAAPSTRTAPETLPATTEAAPETQPSSAEKGFFERDTLTGNWWGLRDKLTDHGITFTADLMLDYSYNLMGGIKAGGALRHALGLGLAVETEPLLHWKGGKFFVGFQEQSGRNVTDDFVGDYQGIDNLEARGLTEVKELWYEQVLFDKKLRVKIGKVDASSEFARAQNAEEFVNAGAGYGFPRYPEPTAGINVFVNPTPWFYGGAAVYEGGRMSPEFSRSDARLTHAFFGDPDHPFLIGETGLKWSLANSTLPGRFGVGAWRYSGHFATHEGERASAWDGAYAIFDQTVWRKNPEDKDDTQGIALFVQYGWDDPSIGEIDHHISAGATWTGAIPSREDDVLGFMGSYVHFTDNPAAGFSKDYEAALECFYKFQFTPWFSLKADLQYVLNPGGNGNDDAVVGTLRAEFAF